MDNRYLYFNQASKVLTCIVSLVLCCCSSDIMPKKENNITLRRVAGEDLEEYHRQSASS